VLVVDLALALADERSLGDRIAGTSAYPGPGRR
jgi:hypothetical protein